MLRNFIKRVKRNKNYLNAIENIPDYFKISNREILLNSITPQTMDTIDEQIRFWNLLDDEKEIPFSNREPIKIYINSSGGDLQSALGLVDSIRMSKTPVFTFNTCLVAKESFLIYMSGHKRYTYPSAIFSFVHPNLLDKEDNKQNEASFYNKTMLLEKIEKSVKDFLIERISLNEEQYDKYCKNEWWFCADEAIALRISNELSKYHYCSQKDKR